MQSRMHPSQPTVEAAPHTEKAAGGGQLPVSIIAQPAAIQLKHIAGLGSLKRGSRKKEVAAGNSGSSDTVPWMQQAAGPYT